MTSKLEVNFSRLLNTCENMASERQFENWRLESYVGALQDQLNELKRSTSKPNQDVLNGYTKKVDLLKSLIAAEKQPTAGDRVDASERILPVSNGVIDTKRANTLQMQVKAKHQKDLRDELLGKSDTSADSQTGLRQRKPHDEDDLDTIIQHHHQIQEKLADEMVMFARNLKENAAAAGKIVRDDTKMVELSPMSFRTLEHLDGKTLVSYLKISDSGRHADRNYSNLKVESDRLEVHTKSCSWWIWIMLALIVVTFLWMIMFMKLFPKPR